MGFNNVDRMALGKLLITPEEKLDDRTIEEWVSHIQHFLKLIFGICGKLLLLFKNGQVLLSLSAI